MSRGRPDLVIFDCDGVLVDSEVISLEVLTGALRHCDIDISVDDALRRFVGHSFSSVRGMIRQAFGAELPDDFESSYRGSLLERFGTDLRPTPGIERFLAGLAVPVAVATSSSPKRVARSLEICGLDRVFAGRVFSASEVERGKPAPDLFEHVSRVLGVPPDRCLVIEDSLPGLAAAKAAGMPALRYVGGAHLRGGRHGTPTPDGIVAFENWHDFPDRILSAAEPGVRDGPAGERR